MAREQSSNNKLPHWTNLESSTSRNREVQDLVNQYTEQLLVGCHSTACSQALCHSGRVNISRVPLRRFTPRSARAIAITICSGPDPRKSLCIYRNSTGSLSSGTTIRHDGPQDTASLTQLICETASVKECTTSDHSIALELQPLHTQLDGLLTSMNPSEDRTTGLSNLDLVRSIMPCLDWLIARLPPQRLAVWTMIDRDIISKGYEFLPRIANRPNDSTYNSWLAILDIINHELYLRLLQRIVLVITHRIRFEDELERLRRESKMPNKVGGLARQKITATFATEWLSARGRDPTKHIALIVWLKKLFTQSWTGTSRMTICCVSHTTLQLIEQLWLSKDIRTVLPAERFQLPMIRSRVDELDLASTWLSGCDHTEVHLLDFPLLFSVGSIFVYFRMINHLKMRDAHSKALKAQGLFEKASRYASLSSGNKQLLHEEEHYLLLYVSRGNIVKDTFDQLWQRRKGELRRPLRVRMGADELDIGHDLGGVQVEFFNLICRHVFSEEAQLFTTDPQTGLSYFRSGSLQPLHMYELVGTLLALALYNGIALPISLPQIFYHLLVEPEKCKLEVHEAVSSIRDGWPAQARSFQVMLDTDVDDLDFIVPWEANGVRLTILPDKHHFEASQGSPINIKVLEASFVHPSGGVTSPNIQEIAKSWPGWNLIQSHERPEPVTNDTKAEYVSLYASWLFYHSVEPQMQALVRGFAGSELIEPRTLSMLGSANLKSLAEGTQRLDIGDLRSSTRYDGYDGKSKYMQEFWRIVTAWPEEKQKQLLKFVTAAERIPITGARSLTFVIKKASPESLDSLPTSSTCFGTLMLPRYGSSDILAEKLSLALRYGSEGFGTG